MNHKRLFTLGLVALIFVLTSLACSVGRFLPGQDVETPSRSVEVNAEAASEAEQAIAEAQAGGTIRLTEAQFTSLLAAQLNQESNGALTNVTVWFEPGTVVVEGDLQEGILPMSGRLVLSGELAAEEGDLSFSISEASVGGIKAPGAAVDLLNSRIEGALSASTFNSGDLQSIRVESGAIVIVRE